MKRRLFPRASVLVVALWSVTAWGVPHVCRAAGEPAAECTPRGGLSDVLAKLKTPGARVKVAYLGGSITAQEGWRPQSLALLQKEYPGAQVSQINAAIGGTGSDLGVFRLRHDVLDHGPDLLFVEFAVNDAGAPPEQVRRCMEGIVRQTWKANSACDVCFVYTVAANLLPDLEAGRFPRATSVMEEVADHYGIPSIHMGLEVARLVSQGKVVFKGPLPKTEEEKRAAGDGVVFSPDGVHPYPQTGHELYLKAIERSLPAIRAASAAGPAPHGLKAPLAADNYEDAKMVPLDKVGLSAGFSRLDPKSDALAKRFGERVPALYRADRSGEALTFRFKGRYAAVYDVIGPDCGQVKVTLDGQEPVVRPRFDAYCTYARLATLTVGAGLPDAVHSVRIEIDAAQPDKAKILEQRHEKMDDPRRFDGTAFYPGAILVVGEMEK